jgi:methylated-DNA-[protein]-cysteine S-methyltransferase
MMIEEPRKIEGELGRAADRDPGDWAKVRDRFAQKAIGEGLVEISYEMHDSPFGPLLVAASGRGLVRVGLAAENEQHVLEGISKHLSPLIVRVPRSDTESARRQLDEYFDGRRRKFDLSLDWSLAHSFRREVLLATERIPYGETRSYFDLADEAGSPRAVRAAGSALANNPLPIVVPCHRVLRADGQVGSYLGGSSMKRDLLSLEDSGNRNQAA